MNPTLPAQPPVQRPPAHLRRRRPTGCWLRALLIALIVMLIPVFFCGLSLVAYIVFPPPTTNILVLGLDSREGEGFATRTDSIMLIGIQPKRLYVSLLSIPRDLFIDVPGYGMQRINTVNVLGELEQAGNGPVLLTHSIEQNFQIQVQHYVRLDFRMFVALVDAVGGLTIDVEKVIVDSAFPTEDGGVIQVRFESGSQTMDGERALIYARTRHGDDDYQRAKRQQQIVSALGAKLANPAHWPAALNVWRSSLDTNLSVWDAVRLLPPLVLNAGRFDRLVIDREYILGTAQGGAVPNYALLRPWITERFN